jgi:hypothetical protein
MRILSLVTIILGIAAIAFGLIFVFQANAGNDEIAASIAPLPMDQVESKYDEVFAMAKNVPQTDPSYLMITGQRTALGLAKANIGNVKAIMTNAYITMGLGLGLVLVGIVSFRKSGE